jgi:pilus assembly protein CpaF
VSFDVILPFLRPIAHLIEDPEVSEIMVNGSGVIFIERDGQLDEVTDERFDERNLIVSVKNIARALGDDVSEERPILDSRLPDGSRVAAILPPCSVGGTTLTIRKFQTRFSTADELVRIGTMPQDVLDQVRTAIEHHRNILISGGTSTGKTMLLNALAAFLPTRHRVFMSWRALVRTERAMKGLVVLAVLRTGLGSGHITPRRVLQGTRGCCVATRGRSVGYDRLVSREHTKIPCDNSCVS